MDAHRTALDVPVDHDAAATVANMPFGHQVLVEGSEVLAVGGARRRALTPNPGVAHCQRCVDYMSGRIAQGVDINIASAYMQQLFVAETVRADRKAFQAGIRAVEKIIQRVLNNITALETGQGGALQAELERAMTSRRSETVLLIGNKGAGKSTFIDRFFEQVLPRRLREKCVVARVDLENYHGDPKAVVGWAILQLRSHLEAAVCSSNPPSYDELMGIFFSEYQRWSVGSRKHLYESNKTEFKDEFGRHMEERREKHADEYVRLLLDWAVRGNQKLPCLIFDNTDQFQQWESKTLTK